MINLNNPENKFHDNQDRTKVYFYRNTNVPEDDGDRIISRCPQCAEEHPDELELIYVAGDLEICNCHCGCEIENWPSWYYGDVEE